jgi:hypothetical protein
MPEQREVKFILNGEAHTLTINVASVPENLESLRRAPLRIATMDYWATGEGRTVYLLAKRAEATFYENILPKDDVVFEMLASDMVREHWRGILSGQVEAGWYEYSASQYINSW